MNPCKNCTGTCTHNVAVAAVKPTVPKIPQTVMDAIYHCQVCNPTRYTLYRCRCDMAPSITRIKAPAQNLEPIIEVEDLPGDLVSRCEAITKIFEQKKEKK